jgi:hypothetical protein
LQEHSGDLTALQTAETIIHRATERGARPGLHVAEISRTLRRTSPEETNHILPWLIGIIVALALLLLLCIIHIRNTGGMQWNHWKRRWNLHSAPKPEVAQMAPTTQSEAEAAAADVEVVENIDKPPTPYSLRGRLAVDPRNQEVGW